MSAGRILVVGDVMRDVMVRPQGPLRRGTDQRAAIRTTHGGSGANQAAWLARFGANVRFAACVGRDDLAPFNERFRRHGVEPALAADPGLPTGMLVAMVDPDGERSFLTDRGANDGLRRDALPADILSDVDWLHLSGYALVGETTRETVLHLFAEARERGIALSFDPGSVAFLEEMGPAQLLDDLGPMALCVANADEAACLTGVADPDAQIASLTVRFDLVLLKRGAAGAIAGARTGERWSVEAPRVAVVDTTGAGDVFLAAFLAARLSGEPIAICLERAVQAGAHAVTVIGGWPI